MSVNYFNPKLLDELFGTGEADKILGFTPFETTRFVEKIKKINKPAPKHISITIDEYELIWDFIMNCCVIHNEEDPDLFLKWEKNRIETLVDFLNRKDKLIQAREKRAE